MKICSIVQCAAVCVLALPLVVGCGGSIDVADVSGIVTLDGKPLDNAIVTFSPEDGGPSGIGRTDEKGYYELYRRGQPGAPIGTHKVMVTSVQQNTESAPSTPPEELTSDSPEYMEQALGGSRPSDYDQAITKEPIPAKYNSQTTLTKTVEPGDNVIDLELTSD